MIETRTWEQLKKDNIGATWIDENGEFCSEYVDIKSHKNLPYWRQPNFNGCWTCNNFERDNVMCKKVERELNKK